MVPQVLLFFSFTCGTDTNCFRNLIGFILFWLSCNSSEPWDFHHPTFPAPSTSWSSKTPRQTLNQHGSPLCSHLLTSLQFNQHRRSYTFKWMQQTSWCSSESTYSAFYPFLIYEGTSSYTYMKIWLSQLKLLRNSL